MERRWTQPGINILEPIIACDACSTYGESAPETQVCVRRGPRPRRGCVCSPSTIPLLLAHDTRIVESSAALRKYSLGIPIVRIVGLESLTGNDLTAGNFFDIIHCSKVGPHSVINKQLQPLSSLIINILTRVQ